MINNVDVFWIVTLNTMINAMFLLVIDVAYGAFFDVFILFHQQ